MAMSEKRYIEKELKTAEKIMTGIKFDLGEETKCFIMRCSKSDFKKLTRFIDEINEKSSKFKFEIINESERLVRVCEK